ncbi:MAG TPA: DUF4976 domain-containing protein [Planctomycetes bacterium]|nr:DUF4976 domain-containing protein [Planctomycetota bacterium]HIL52047.1 DUF4976 domain-containing protein [Planctomycetota bacterium]
MDALRVTSRRGLERGPGWRLRLGLTSVLGCLASLGCGGGQAEPSPLNVLFLSIDDLRPELGSFGADEMHTPHMDSIARAGVSFTSAYCQQAVCGPSRASMLTGCRPDTTGVLTLRGDFRDALPEHVSLPQLFKENGWTSYALGKVHHGQGELDDEPSWSRPCWRPDRWQRYYASSSLQELVNRRNAEESDTKGFVARVALMEQADAPDAEYPDARIADEAIRFLREEGDAPFFLAVGFLKPHLPFVAPKAYWDLYPAEGTELASRRTAPQGAPAWAGHVSGELRSYEDVPDEAPFSEAEEREFRRGYRACISFVDAQIGRVLQALNDVGLRENTIVVLWGDHGWHLGDLGLFGKHTNYENATRAPLIVSVPHLPRAGESCSALVEFVDIYPTLADLCGLEVPVPVEGLSLAPLLAEPGRPWKTAAFSQYPRFVAGAGRAMGRSLRTRRYRLVEWTVPGSDLHEVELYDLGEEAVETVNLAGVPEHRKLLEELLERLHEGWRGALPGRVAEKSGM